MKRTIYLLSAILFAGSCLMVSTTTLDTKKIDIDNAITYVNSSILPTTTVVTEVPVIDTVEEKVVVEEEVMPTSPKTVPSSEEIEPKVEETPQTAVTPEVSPSVQEENNISTNPSILTGSMSGYGADIGDYTASGYYIKDTITYYDKTYKEVRILAAGSEYAFGTIIKVTNSNAGDFIGIVLDRGPDIGQSGKFTFDLLYKTSSEALKYGVSKNINYQVLREGF